MSRAASPCLVVMPSPRASSSCHASASPRAPLSIAWARAATRSPPHTRQSPPHKLELPHERLPTCARLRRVSLSRGRARSSCRTRLRYDRLRRVSAFVVRARAAVVPASVRALELPPQSPPCARSSSHRAAASAPRAPTAFGSPCSPASTGARRPAGAGHSASLASGRLL
ncbi:hypothetical protein PR202_gb22799 [Eleusine coracana subsp. coracana]|uniref:Uncharacterized protein n=1 Tax=Eleusine coracana subsp. coracana TaxID=191504 RepID=A0AAV5FIS3_ELECO|nr:hypothetical protein PR202_gb22799 [Eleusine coracana subsp. coracana]